MRAATTALLDALIALESVQAELAAIALRTDAARRADLVHLRRALSLQIAATADLGERVMVGADAQVLRDYRRHLSAMRSAAAMHQATWPAVRLGEDDIGYRRSAQTVRDANKAFVGWVRAALATAPAGMLPC